MRSKRAGRACLWGAVTLLVCGWLVSALGDGLLPEVAAVRVLALVLATAACPVLVVGVVLLLSGVAADSVRRR